MYCSNCGKKLSKKIKFCPNCGIEIHIRRKENVQSHKEESNHESKEGKNFEKLFNDKESFRQEEGQKISNSRKNKDVLKLEKKANTSFVLGIIGLIAWIIPIIGLPIQIIGIVLAKKALKVSRQKKAKAGLIMCIIGLIFSILNSLAGIYMNSPELFEGAFEKGLIGLILGGIVATIMAVSGYDKKK